MCGSLGCSDCLPSPQKNYGDFAKELATPEIDVNQPDSKGRLPLLEAVKTKDIRFVDGLLQYRALASSVDPATGTNPLLEAFKLGLTEVGQRGKEDFLCTCLLLRG